MLCLRKSGHIVPRYGAQSWQRCDMKLLVVLAEIYVELLDVVSDRATIWRFINDDRNLKRFIDFCKFDLVLFKGPFNVM